MVDLIAENTLNIVDLYRERKFYKESFFPQKKALPRPFDFLYENPKYGFKNSKGHTVYLLVDDAETNLKTIEGSNVKVINFVADAFSDFRRDYINRINNKVYPPLQGLESLDPASGFLPLDSKYYRYLNGIRSFMTERFLFDYRILNFEDFVAAFGNFLSIMSDVFPITRSGFIESPNCAIGSTGLIIELSQLDYEKDFPKGKIIQSHGFECYLKLANDYGFYVDKNGPWRLLANLENPNMQEYIKKYSLVDLSVDKILNTRYYIKSHYDDIYEIRNFAKSVYEEFIRVSPFHVEKDGKVRSYMKRNTKIPNYDEEYWLDLLVQTRILETRSKETIKDKEQDITSSASSRVISDYKVYGLKSSLGKLGDIIAKQAIAKNIKSIDSFKPTKIGDYL